MLGKLFKYELKATSRIFLPLYATILITALINGLFASSELFKIQAILSIVFFALLIAIGVITLLVLIQRFSKNLLGDEGYLMFTLPVSSTSIILSKYLVAILWSLLSVVVIIMAFSLITTVAFEGSFFYYSFFSIIAEEGFLPLVFTLCAYIVIGYSVFMFTIYLSLSISQLPPLSKHKMLSSFFSFIALNTILSFIQSVFEYSMFDVDNLMMNFEANPIGIFNDMMIKTLISLSVFNIVIIVLLFFGIKYILDKKLNLE